MRAPGQVSAKATVVKELVLHHVEGGLPVRHRQGYAIQKNLNAAHPEPRTCAHSPYRNSFAEREVAAVVDPKAR